MEYTRKPPDRIGLSNQPLQVADAKISSQEETQVSGKDRSRKRSQIRVCMLAYTFYECDNRVMRYAQTLQRRGYHIDVIAARRVGQGLSEVIGGVNVFRIQERIVNEKARSTYLLRQLCFFFKAMAFITRNHLTNRYDIIHVHSVPDFLVFAAWVTKLTGSKIILDIHDLLPEFYASKFKTSQGSLAFRFLKAIERISAAFADHVIVANDIWLKTLVSRSARATKCTAILNFPDTSIFFRRGRTRVDRKFIIIYPGTLNHHQGVDIAIRAFARIKSRAPNAEFHIYGSGPLKSVLANMIDELNLRGEVFLNDMVPATKIAFIMENADLGLVPKRAESFGNEAFSTKILEFMAVGIPVLAAETKIERYYLNESLIRFFRSNDEEGLADSLLDMIGNKSFCCSLVKNAEEFIRHNNWKVKESLYLEIVKSLLDTSQSDPTCRK